MKSRALSAWLALVLAAALGAASAVGAAAAPAGPANSAPTGVSGPPSPATTSSDDFQARMALDRDEQQPPGAASPQVSGPASAELSAAPAAPPTSAGAAPAGRSSAPSAGPTTPGRAMPGVPTADLGGLFGLGLSAAFLALGFVFAWAQRRHLTLLFRPGKASRAAAPIPQRAAAGPAPAAPRSARAAAPAAAPAPLEAARTAAEVETLRQLATELQRTISELRAERTRWEKEWEQREMQWSRWLKTHAGSAAQGSRGASSPALAELEQAALPGLADDELAGADKSTVLGAVERMLAQGLSAEEISRRLRVGLREIQWMMRLGALEARS